MKNQNWSLRLALMLIFGTSAADDFQGRIIRTVDGSAAASRKTAFVYESKDETTLNWAVRPIKKRQSNSQKETKKILAALRSEVIKNGDSARAEAFDEDGDEAQVAAGPEKIPFSINVYQVAADFEKVADDHDPAGRDECWQNHKQLASTTGKSGVAIEIPNRWLAATYGRNTNWLHEGFYSSNLKDWLKSGEEELWVEERNARKMGFKKALDGRSLENVDYSDSVLTLSGAFYSKEGPKQLPPGKYCVVVSTAKSGGDVADFTWRVDVGTVLPERKGK